MIIHCPHTNIQKFCISLYLILVIPMLRKCYPEAWRYMIILSSAAVPSTSQAREYYWMYHLTSRVIRMSDGRTDGWTQHRPTINVCHKKTRFHCITCIWYIVFHHPNSAAFNIHIPGGPSLLVNYTSIVNSMPSLSSTTGAQEHIVMGTITYVFWNMSEMFSSPFRCGGYILIT